MNIPSLSPHVAGQSDVSTLEIDLEHLRDKILILGGQAESAVALSSRSLLHRDSSTADRVIAEDDEVDNIESEIDQLCADILGRYALSREDLWFVLGVVRCTPMIERIADHAVNIARHALRLNDEPQLKPYIDLPGMFDLVQKMLIASLDALTQRDAEKACSIIRRDDEVDRLYRKIFDELTVLMTMNPVNVVRATELLFVIKHLERIADIATNICEEVVYVVEGRSIKHKKSLWS